MTTTFIRYRLQIISFQVKVNNDVIADWAGGTAEELQKMRSTLKQRPQQRQQMENILKQLGDKIAVFDGFMKIQFADKNKMPEVTEIIESKANFEEILKKKLAKGV